MKKIKLITFLLISLLSSRESTSQVKSSQFYSTPLLINPATTGRFDKSYRTGGSFRNEKSSQKKDFNQSVLFFDAKILNNIVPENDCLAIGIVGMSENGISEGIRNSYLSFSLGYQKALDEEGKKQVGLGFQTSYAHKSITKPNLVFESDLISFINSGYSDIDIFQIQNIDFSYFDLNAGIIYQGTINPKSLFSVGVSVYHITEPKNTFLGGKFSLPRQIWTHASFEKKLGVNNKVYSGVLLGISGHRVNDLIAGLLYEFSINKNNFLSVGGWLRENTIKGNSIIPSLGLNFYDFVLNFSYDINISSNTASQRGASEVSLIYTIAKTRERFLEKRFIKF